jgi:CubicO group peptidase (beta-lactamase class C family)
VYDRDSYCLGGEGGNAGLFAAAPGVLQLLSLFENGGLINDVRLLSPSQVKLMRSSLTSGLGARRSFGFRLQGKDSPVGSLYGEQSYGHTGSTGTSVWIEPAGGLTVVMLTSMVHEGTGHRRFVDFRKQLHTLIRSIWV